MDDYKLVGTSESSVSEVAIQVKPNLLAVSRLPSGEQIEEARVKGHLNKFMRQWRQEHPVFWRLYLLDGRVVEVER